jgi:hypothetical protein
MTLGQYLAECHAGDEALLALHAAIVDAAEMDSEVWAAMLLGRQRAYWLPAIAGF